MDDRREDLTPPTSMSSVSHLLPHLNPTFDIGHLDWATGLVRINSTHQEWEDIVSRLPREVDPDELDLVETVTHESMHFLQVVTTGYAYRLALQLWHALRACVIWPIRTMDDVLPDIPMSVRRRIEILLRRYQRSAPNGLSASGIAESQALHCQKAVHYPNLSAGEFRDRVIKYDRPELYTLAYDLTCDELGSEELAFELYPYLAMLSLCTANPATTLSRLLRRPVAASLTRANDQQARLNILDSEMQYIPHSMRLGTAAEAQQALGNHPIYSGAVYNMNDLLAKGDLDVRGVFAAPHNALVRIQDAIRPILFDVTEERKIPVIVPEGLWPGMTDSDKTITSAALVALHAVSRRAVRSDGFAPPGRN